jgi:cellulose synthase/poly-beta-1,6-N-acetylglucosamine synthase-like glycosyltransferase
VRNQAGVIAGKLQNLLTLDYPEDSYEVVIVSDGSDDATDEILESLACDERLRLIRCRRHGKAAGLNRALSVVRGDIIVFTDVRQKVAPDAIRLLMQNFADPSVGCASGQLMLGTPESDESVKGVGLYWKIEKTIRALESASGSVVGATGALYAVRRDLLSELDPQTILDDVYIPMTVVRKGLRVVFDERAQAWDAPDFGSRREFSRKVRTLTGNYQLLQVAPWLLSAGNPIRFEFVSHKLLRLLVPFALLTMLTTTIYLQMPIYRIALLVQVGFYAMALLSLLPFRLGPAARAADAVFTFVLLNAAAAVAFGKFVTGRKPVWN